MRALVCQQHILVERRKQTDQQAKCHAESRKDSSTGHSDSDAQMSREYVDEVSPSINGDIKEDKEGSIWIIRQWRKLSRRISCLFRYFQPKDHVKSRRDSSTPNPDSDLQISSYCAEDLLDTDVDSMDDEKVTSYIMELIGSTGRCTSGDSKRTFLKNYLLNLKQKASSQTPVVFPDINKIPYMELLALLHDQIGDVGNCNDEQSQRELLRAYLNTVKERISQTNNLGAPVKTLPTGKPLSIVLLGETGDGKSTTANSILGEERFESKMSSTPVTTKCAMEKCIIAGREISVVDTPGTMNTPHREEALKEIGTAITLVPQGFDAFVIVLNIDVRITEMGNMAITNLKKMFGHDFLVEFGVVVFTRGDRFMHNSTKSKETFEDYITSQTGYIPSLLEECKYRYALIDNLQSDPDILRDQVIKIIALIDKLVTINDGRMYTNDMFYMAQQKLEELPKSSNKEKAEL